MCLNSHFTCDIQLDKSVDTASRECCWSCCTGHYNQSWCCCTLDHCYQSVDKRNSLTEAAGLDMSHYLGNCNLDKRSPSACLRMMNVVGQELS